MKVLVVGSGGREHSLVWKLAQSKKVTKIFCAPGNAGIASMATNVNISASDIDGLIDFAGKENIDLTVVGPEVSLTLGIVDSFQKKGLRIFGPDQKAAILEGSKVFTKDLMEKYGIPSGTYKVFTDRVKALSYLDGVTAPIVVKADGLAAGKGVIVALSIDEAKKAVDQIMEEKAFGDAGHSVVIEEFLVGEEASFIAFTDGKTVLPLPTSQDHKAVFDGDKGPNTGGMGAYSPAPVVTEAMHNLVMEQVMYPTVKAMEAEGRPYKGMLYAGLMIDGGKVKILEFNCRFGDPEAQPLLMRLKTDLVDILEAIIDERLNEITLEIDPRPTVCVVMASGGYPGSYEKGKAISGLDAAAEVEDVMVFHAGTALQNGNFVNVGGRVLGITAIGETLQDAIDKAYTAVGMIHWDECYFRKDIGQKALQRKNEIPKVGIVMGSDSDLPIMTAARDFLLSMGIPYEMTVASAHRTPARACEYASTARQRGLKVIIAGAGMAAHLAGVLAAHTTLPVIGIPIDSSSLNGLDSLLSTVQMPPGIPVATMGIGKAGAKNGAILATQILAVSDESLAEKLLDFKEQMAREVEEKARKIQ
ncbi:MAG: phosphoribosylamine--glycine ligase [Desulfobulbaceae bacterium]|uniref:Multifunctional fusion protein n=1 Tax=Candidatus Desulfobia pelagia TaxID=2841692 RepID=A0A8J6NAP2_9BACT|nr:phosphoribosylamine--glycine ligase [Candidatus Desulfobia pelagia]